MLLFARISLLIILLFPVTAGKAAEIDSVIPRHVALDDSLSALNSIFNSRIREGVEQANDRQSDYEDIQTEEFCNEDILYDELRKAVFQSFTASIGLKGYSLDKQLRTLLVDKSYSLALQDSVYRDISYIKGFSLNLKELSDVVKINGHVIGLDKIGHFFAEGWEYFELTHYKDNTLQQAIKWGREQEQGKFGYATTGIFSYSDLVANFNGWRFWNDVLHRENDPLKDGIANFFSSPLVKCRIRIIDSIRLNKRVRAWKIKKHFDLSDYLDGTWDEGNNCNSYKDPAIEEKVSARIKNADPHFICPQAVEHCLHSRKKHGEYAKYVLHPACLTASATQEDQ